MSVEQVYECHLAMFSKMPHVVQISWMNLPKILHVNATNTQREKHAKTLYERGLEDKKNVAPKAMRIDISKRAAVDIALHIGPHY